MVLWYNFGIMKFIKALVLILAILVLAAGGYFFYDLYVRQDQSGFATNPDVIKVADIYNSGDIDAAVSQAEDIATKKPNDIDVLLALAVSYAEKGSVGFSEQEYGQKAIDTANKVLALDSKNSEAHRVIGYSYEIMEQYEKAILEYKTAISLNSKNSQAYSNLGHAYDLQGDIDTALEWYEKALIVSPINEHGLLNIARVEIRKGNSKDAETHLQKLFLITQNSRFKAEGYQLLAFIHVHSSGDIAVVYDKTLEALNLSLQYDPTVPQVWVSLGDLKYRNLYNTYRDKDAFRRTIAEIWDHIDKALAINKNQASAYYLGSRLASIEGDLAKKEEYKKKALDAIPLDITLGQTEKEALKTLIEMKITITSKPKK